MKFIVSSKDIITPRGDLKLVHMRLPRLGEVFTIEFHNEFGKMTDIIVCKDQADADNKIFAYGKDLAHA